MLRALSDNANESSLAVQLRRKRHAFFEHLLAELPTPIRILDVGGTEAFWSAVGFSGDARYQITLLNLSEEVVSQTNITSLAGDARSLPFEDQSFDVAFSNSVIEHLPNEADQAKMAHELLRVAPRYFVQTPNYYFPIEPHFLVPGFQFFSEDMKTYLIKRYDLGWVPKQPTEDAAREVARSVKLLTAPELTRLFPGAKLYRERFLGLTKSLIVYGGW